LYIDFQWALPGRRLQGANDWVNEPTLPTFKFNKNDDGTIKQKNYDFGPLRCENCYASFIPTLKFKMETVQSMPQRVSLTVGGEIDISVSLGLTDEAKEAIKKAIDPKTAETAWKDFKDTISSSLIDSATKDVSLPLFSSFAPQSFNVKLEPVFAPKVRLFTEAAKAFDEDLKVLVGTNLKADFTLAWDKDKGFSVTADFQNKGSKNEVKGNTKAWDLMAGIRTCLGMNLVAGATTITGLESCPELQISAQNLLTSSTPAVPEELQANTVSLDGGDDFCFTLESFSTDADLDMGNADEAYGKVCFFGVCKATAKDKQFNGDKVTFSEQLCLKGPKGLKDGFAYLHFLEDDSPGFDDQYTKPYKLDLSSSSCPGIEKQTGCLKTDLNLERYSKAGGTYAKATIKVVNTAARRLTARERRLQNKCLGTAVSRSMGVSAKFQGVQFPDIFSSGGGTQLIDPVETPTYKPKGPETACVGEEEASLATTMTSPALSLVVGVLVIWVGLVMRDLEGF